jgi:hypothetical protein
MLQCYKMKTSTCHLKALRKQCGLFLDDNVGQGALLSGLNESLAWVFLLAMLDRQCTSLEFLNAPIVLAQARVDLVKSSSGHAARPDLTSKFTKTNNLAWTSLILT